MVQTHFVKFGSQAWGEARRIRYSVFFEPHDLPLSVMDDSQETDAIHLVAIEVSQVVGYSRLFDLGHGQFQISQMVILPAHQHQGIGQLLLQTLIHKAQSLGATSITLKARLPAIQFYTKQGFQPCGEVFASAKTGVPHVNMTLREINSYGICH